MRMVEVVVTSPWFQMSPPFGYTTSTSLSSPETEVDQRRHIDIEDAGDVETRAAAVNRHVDRFQNRTVDRDQGSAQHFPGHTAFLAGKDAPYGLDLGRAGRLVDEQDPGAIAFVDGPGPLTAKHRPNPGEIDVAEVSLDDLVSDDGFAIAVVGKAIELAAAAVAAVTRFQDMALSRQGVRVVVVAMSIPPFRVRFTTFREEDTRFLPVLVAPVTIPGAVRAS
jgi:hypothetical protein